MVLRCPECGSKSLYKDGLRYLASGESVQRLLCRSCGYRFSEPKVKVNIAAKPIEPFNSGANLTENMIGEGDFAFKESFNGGFFLRRENVRSHVSNPHITNLGKELNKFRSYNSDCRVCVSEAEAKNLATVESKSEKRAAGATKQTADAKSKIIEFAWWMKKQGYSENTITRRTKLLLTLAKRGANLYNAETVKELITRQESWNSKTKELAVEAYSCFLKMLGESWDPPRFMKVEKLPFIPTREELSQLIASCNKRVATFLQLLMETGARAGEAWRLTWKDFDFEQAVVRITPEKGGKPRALKISQRLIAMLKQLPSYATAQKPFMGSFRHFMRTYSRNRAKASRKLGNQRLLQITFHTFRHWKATMEYARTKDILYVKELLGHRNIQSTLLYTQLINFESDEYIVKRPRTPREEDELIHAGFEFVRYDEKEQVPIYRKRK